MSNTRHTPGPWIHNVDFKLYEKDRYSEIKAGDGCTSVEYGYKGFALTGVMSDADAKLIAAAPELLEALQALKAWAGKLEDWKGEDPPLELVDNAIKQATE